MADSLTQLTIGNTHFDITDHRVGSVGLLNYGTGTQTFLRNDGTWQTPPGTSSGHTHPKTSLTNPTITSGVQTNDSTRFFWNATNVHAYKDVNGTIFFDGTMNIRLGLTAGTKYDNAYILKIDGSALSGYAGGIGVAGNIGFLDVHANGYINFRPLRDVAAGTNDIPIRGIIY